MVDGTDRLEEIEAAPPRHLLVEQHHTVGLTLEQDQGVVPVRGGLDGETLLFQKQDVRGQTLHLIIHPQYALGSGHALS